MTIIIIKKPLYRALPKLYIHYEGEMCPLVGHPHKIHHNYKAHNGCIYLPLWGGGEGGGTFSHD